MPGRTQPDDLLPWLRLTLTPGIGRAQARRLLARLGPPEQWLGTSANAALPEDLPPDVTALLGRLPDNWSRQAHRLTQWLEQTARDGIPRVLIPLGDPAYPELLLHTQDPPVLLYVMGQGLAHWPLRRGLSIVGSRQPSLQGREHARHFAQAMVAEGWTVVSGMALGIDAEAHEGALRHAQADPLPTVAVVGTGLDRVYPRQHHDLAQRIAQCGVLVSEYPLGTAARPHHFPQRNRIISGLTQGTLVVEAACASGSLLTARLAAEQGREVFALPGPLHAPQSEGCHWLIRQGATLVTSPQDILEELSAPFGACVPTSPPDSAEPAPSPASPASSESLPPELELLGQGPVALDTVVARSGIDAAQWQAWLLEWELEGWVERIPGGRFQRLYRA